MLKPLLIGVQRHPAPVLLLCLLLAAISLRITVSQLRIDTDTADMIDASLPFRQNYERFKQAFPERVDNVLVVIDAGTAEAAELARDRLAERLAADPAHFLGVYRPGAGPWFERNALLFPELDELEALSERLITMQPLLGRLSHEPTLARFADTLARALTDPDLDLGEELEAALQELDRSFSVPGRRLSWQRLLSGDDADAARRFLLLQPRLDFGDLLAAGPAIAALRQAAAALPEFGSTDLRLRISGDAALAHEELLSAMRGAQLAGWLALLMVSIVLWLALRSFRLVLAALLTLITGLALTAGFATVAIGHLNLISIAFAVLYIGLGVDYAIHVCLRYRELLGRGAWKSLAIHRAVRSVARSLLICTLTTATAFYAFLPTAFAGVAELGLISGTGMFINLLLSLLMLPALLQLLRVPAPWHPAPPRRAWADWPLRHPGGVALLSLVLALAAATRIGELRFDSDPLNLRDPDSESVATLRELLADPAASPLTIELLIDAPDHWPTLRSELERLETVHAIVQLDDIIPESDDDKLMLLDELSLVLGEELTLEPVEHEPSLPAARAALARLQTALASAGERVSDRQLLARLNQRVAQWLEALAAPQAAQARADELRQRLYAYLPLNLARLSLALAPDEDPADTVPGELRRRWISASGIERASVQPAENLGEADALRRFVDSVLAVAPAATGPPVIAQRAGDAVVAAFVQAFSLALLLILVLLLLLLRSPIAVALVISPLILATLITLAVLVLLDQPLNFANIIALPLLFGVGVDNGIHIVERARLTRHPGANPLLTSTARAVLFSALTTMCGFGNLLWSPHPGTASMGLVLTIGMLATLLTTLGVLPALLRLWPATSRA